MDDSSNDLSKMIKSKTTISLKANQHYKPLFFRASDKDEKQALLHLIGSEPSLVIYDTLEQQLQELVKCRFPAFVPTPENMQKAVSDILNGTPAEDYGVWVYYPWSKKLVHLTDEDEFIEIRTSRNKQKITTPELQTLLKKKIGIIGLSVGQSVALTVAMERICGELRIADFDTLELTNVNRIRTGLHNLGLPKIVIAAREIAEIDPFLKVVCYTSGITEDNIDSFLTENGKLDLLIEECDSLDIKVLSRQRAKAHQVPVIMDTNDRGMVDIERYDLTPDYPIFHGLLKNIDYNGLKNLDTKQKIPFLLQLISVNTASKRSRVSLIELGSSIGNFPQLASSVVLGGAVATDVARRILLNQLHISGRFHIDLDAMIADEQPVDHLYRPKTFEPLRLDDMLSIAAAVPADAGDAVQPSFETLKKIVTDAGLAPSSGNDQPWRFLYKDGRVLLFHDISRSYSFGDYRNMAAYTSLGSAIENFVLSAQQSGLGVSTTLFPLKDNQQLIASLTFADANHKDVESNEFTGLADYLDKRCTNRKVTQRQAISLPDLDKLSKMVPWFSGANLQWVTDVHQLTQVGKIISAVDRMRLMHPHGHYDFFHREMRWSDKEAMEKRNGMDVHTLELPPEALIALNIMKDPEVIKTVREIDGAQALRSASLPHAATSSAIGLLSMPSYTPADFVIGGRIAQRLWLQSTEMNIAFQPLIAPLYLFPRIIFGNGEDLPPYMIDELQILRQQFLQIFPGSNERGEVFLFRIFKAADVEKRSLRLKLEDILHVV
ncbi:Rv1355c family protein [Panacibacter sp. DH6]|uniref:Rv1355c family protein n=1 Tax=Panacibacter microcysteis TaxID=2793269 RepID=A0A931GYA4_9BACT|nr:Rv1355c family protein [Panacibacter microcysteis]MBG9375042.1 Rv1355c family protein [Panacibacter microcysteis]